MWENTKHNADFEIDISHAPPTNSRNDEHEYESYELEPEIENESDTDNLKKSDAKRNETDDDSDTERDEAGDITHDTVSEAVLKRYPQRHRRSPGDWWRSAEAAYLVSDTSTDPKSYEKAIQSPDAEKWIELEQIEAHGRWEEGEEIPDTKPLTTKLLLKKKLNSSEEVARYKARLVVHGYKQRFGVDF